MKRTVTAMAALCALSSMAEARVRTPAVSPECNITMPCVGVGNPISTRRQVHARQQRREIRRTYASLEQPAPRAFSRRHRSVEQREAVASAEYSVGLVGPLREKLSSIEAACPGTHAISGVRHTRIAGTRRMSLHAQGKAVDVRGPYGCIYAQLKGWRGGYSTDAGRVRHVHISYDASGGREMGLRFAHGGHRHAWRESFARLR